MTRDLTQIPEGLLRATDTGRLIEWLDARGWRVTLLELETERERRGISSDSEERRRGVPR